MIYPMKILHLSYYDLFIKLTIPELNKFTDRGIFEFLKKKNISALLECY